ETLQAFPAPSPGADVFVVAVGAEAEVAALALAEQLRSELPALRVQCNSGGGSFKSQFKKADKSGARVALILAEDELEKGLVAIKPLRDAQQEQQLLAVADIADYIKEYVK